MSPKAPRKTCENSVPRPFITTTCSGPAGLVEQYTEGKQILTSHSLGGLKTVTLQEESTEPLPAGLERSSMRLQDYFISLQEAEDGTTERKDANHVYES